MANETQAKPQPQRIPLAKIHDLPGVFITKQPDKSYGGLVTSIQANGVKEAVILRLREDGEYQLVTGYRRRRASELAKQQDIPAYVYEMTLKEAVTYHARVNAQPNTPIPGKLVTQAAEVPAKDEKAAEPADPTKNGKTEVPKTEDKAEKVAAPAEAPKEAGKAADPAKPEVPAKGEKAAEPTAPTKDGKNEAAPKAEGKEEKAIAPAGPPKEMGKATDPAKAETPAKGEKAAEPATPTKGGKTEAAPKAEGKEEKAIAPAGPPKEMGKATDPAKAETPAKGEKAAEPATPTKDGKIEAASKTEGKEEKATVPPEPPKEMGKVANPAKPETPTKGEKATGPAVPTKDGKIEAAPKAEGKEEKTSAPAEPSKEAGKAADPAKPETPAKDEKAAEPADPTKNGKTEVPKTEDKAEKVAAPAEAPKEAVKAADPAKPEVPAKGEKATEPATPIKSEKAVTPTSPAKETKPEKAAAVIGPAALGPAGTAITKIFEQRLAPPSEQDMKNLPVPNEGESFFITLHPGYLAKSKFNTFSVDTTSENFKELRKSVELVGIKDPVLTRINPEGGLEILSGQRRHLAAAALNYPVPAIIQKIDDADAKIIVADGNLHRDKISSYDLSRALRMKMEGMKQKSGRRKKGEIKAEELDSDEKLAIEMGMSVSKLNRFIRLSEAVKDVCDRVDNNSLALSIASAISFLKPANQNVLLTFVDRGYKVTNDRVERMKKVEKTAKLDEEKMWEILEDKDIQKTVVPPAPAPAPTPTPAAPAVTEPVTLPQSPDVKPTAPTVNEPVPAAPVTPAASAAPTAPTAPEKEPDIFKGAQERPENTKVILTGDRLRRYFPDVNMTPREIEESVYEALEERRQRQMKMQRKTEIFKKPGPTR